MLESLTIDGVRGIDHLHLDGLSLVNVIAGDNGTGKTTILESTVLLFERSLAELRRAQTNRGIPIPREIQTTTDDLSQAIFAGFSSRGEATISGRWAEDVWEIHLYTATRSLAEYQKAVLEGEEDADRLRFHVETTVNGSQKDADQAETPKKRLLATTDRKPGSDDATTLGDLRLSGGVREAVAGLRTIIPDAQDVEFIRSSAGAGFFIRLNERGYVPLGAFGGGANALLHYLLALQKVAGGILAIDEVEGGFHYSRVGIVFKALLTAARLSGTQIFCTTHSKEVLTALVEAAAETEENDLSVISTYRDENGRIAAQVLRERDALNSIEYGYELR